MTRSRFQQEFLAPAGWAMTVSSYNGHQRSKKARQRGGGASAKWLHKEISYRCWSLLAERAGRPVFHTGGGGVCHNFFSGNESKGRWAEKLHLKAWEWNRPPACKWHLRSLTQKAKLLQQFVFPCTCWKASFIIMEKTKFQSRLWLQSVGGDLKFFINPDAKVLIVLHSPYCYCSYRMNFYTTTVCFKKCAVSLVSHPQVR